MKSGYQPLQELDDQKPVLPPFFTHQTVYSVMSKYLDLDDLAMLSASAKRGHSYLMNLLNNQPELFLNALLRMPKTKIAAFLRRFPYNLEIIQNLYHRLPDNPAAFTLWAMITNANIDKNRLEVCMDYFEEQGHFKAVATLHALKYMALIAHFYRIHPTGEINVNNISSCTYQNYQGLHLCNLVAPDDTRLIFSDIDFSGANFSNSIFENVTFVNCDFTGADLSFVSFVGVSFTGLNNFTNANLSFADLSAVTLRHDYHRQFIFDGANFNGTRFFTQAMTTHGHLNRRVMDLPFPFLSPNTADSRLERNNYLAIYTPVTNSLIATIMAYSEDQYEIFRHSDQFQVWYGEEGMTLDEFKCFMLKTAMHKIDFFSRHKSIAMFQLNDFFSIQGFNRNSIFTPAQRQIRAALRELRDDTSCCFNW